MCWDVCFFADICLVLVYNIIVVQIEQTGNYQKRICAVLMLSLLLVGMIRTTASAADYVDKIFSFYISNTYDETDPYTKYTTSSVYIHVTDARTNFVNVQAWGYYQNSGWVNRTVGTTARVPVAALPNSDSAKTRIRAALLENNNNQPMSVKLRFTVNSEPTVVVGVWSPDCKGNYPAAN